MSYYGGGYGGYGGYGGDGGGGGGGAEENLFVKAAVEVKRVLPSLFNIKVVRCCMSLNRSGKGGSR